jgi:hypothetical protein
MSTHMVTFCYFVGDIGWEAYKLRKRGFKSEKNHDISTVQLVVERAILQGVASIVVPYFLIHNTINAAEYVFRRAGRYQTVGPILTGLSVISFLPEFVDPPVESAIEYVLQRYGPWSHVHASHHQHQLEHQPHITSQYPPHHKHIKDIQDKKVQ